MMATNSNIYVNPRFIYEYKNILKSDSNDIIVGGISYECKSDRYYELYLLGTTLDWEKGAFKSEFTITNPNSKSSCGCGESFSI